MQEAEEQGKYPSAPAEPDQPLFHPCKCSGTIRYIHQDCLTTWLAHSKKKTCDVCKHPYSFTKVGESTAWWISNRPRPNHNETLSLFQKVRYEGGIPDTKNLLSRITAHPAWISLSADIFAGQIIAALIVLTFVAVFLLREWISQNARPGLFEDEEVMPEEQANIPMIPEPQPPPPPPPPAPLPMQRIQGFPEPDVFARQQFDAIRALDRLRGRDQGEDEDEEAAKDRPRPDASPDDGSVLREAKRLNRGTDHSESGATPLPGEIDFQEHMRGPEYKRRVNTARVLAARRRSAVAKRELRKTQGPPLLPDDQTFDFTFTAMRHPSDSGETDVPEWLTPPASSSESQASSSSTFFPPVTLQPPKDEIPYSISSWGSSSSPSTPAESPSVHLDEPGPSQRRPTLPASTMATANSGASFTISPGRSPVGSPGLATYHPPELFDIEPGPSSGSSYFDTPRQQSQDASQGLGTDEEDHETAQLDVMEDVLVPRPIHARHELELLTDSDDTDEDEGALNRVADDLGQPDVPPRLLPLVEFERDDEDDDDEENDEDIFFVDEEEAERMRQAAAPIQLEGNPQQQNANANPPVNGVQGNDENGDFDFNDEMDGNVEDDMEGALEAIGMRGPILGVFQNAALMVFVLDTAIGLCIWIPFTVGKTTALLTLDPQRMLQIIHLPIKGMRLVTDPIVDFIAYVITRFLLPPWIQLIRKFVNASTSFATTATASIFGNSTADNISQFSNKLYEQSLEIFENPLSHFAFWSTPTQISEIAPAPEPEFLFPEYARFLEPYFALLGKQVRLSGSTSLAAWTRMAVGNGPTNKVFAIILGYSVFGLMLAVYLNLLTVGNARTAGRAIRNAIRQQLLVVKVAGFIFIELVVFPLGCGVVLDACTIWLFAEANIQSRIAFFSQAPLTAMFYHWIAGTLFMYSFAVLLSGCRSIMRPGAMWFIKDPQDQNAHPIRDILERPTFTQLRKICVSGIMYSVVVACVVGSVAGLLVLGNKSIMPFRWKNREPLSNVPVDLLFLHLVLPQTMHHFRPKRAVKQLAAKIWKHLARHFRLTSYFFGGRHSAEETPTRGWPFGKSDSKGHDQDKGVADGTFRRVPATDYLALPRDVRATAQVHEDGTPVDEEAAKLLDQQNQEAEKAKHDPTKDYMIVFIPPLFRYRLVSFVLSLWSICAVLLGLAVAIPIQLGRSVFKVFTPREVHDGYSFLVGFYLLWGCYLTGKAVDRLDKRRQRVRVDDGPHADLRILVFKRSLLWSAKTLYMGISLGVVIPILLAMVVDLYIVLPIRSALTPGLVPKVRLVDAWALGLLYGKIALHVTQLHPPNQVTQGLHHIMANGWVRLDPIAATKEVIAPLLGGLLGMILVPGLGVQLIQRLVPAFAPHKNEIFNLYPAIFMVAGLIRSSFVVYDILASWSQTIRDKEFLVELRLKNHEPEVEKEKVPVADTLPNVGAHGEESPL
ncbi:hypothetical protein MD484_g3273, partial [Candolleomyces efflorescens]